MFYYYFVIGVVAEVQFKCVVVMGFTVGGCFVVIMIVPFCYVSWHSVYFFADSFLLGGYGVVLGFLLCRCFGFCMMFTWGFGL